MCAIDNLLNTSIPRWLTKGVLAVELSHGHYNSDTLFGIALYLGLDEDKIFDLSSVFNGKISLTIYIAKPSFCAEYITHAILIDAYLSNAA